jgi:hypothetical protein
MNPDDNIDFIMNIKEVQYNINNTINNTNNIDNIDNWETVSLKINKKINKKENINQKDKNNDIKLDFSLNEKKIIKKKINYLNNVNIYNNLE